MSDTDRSLDPKCASLASGDFYDNILNKPAALASLQDMDSDSKLHALEYYHKLPSSVKRRIRALKKLQHETVMIDATFYRELFELEMKYDTKHQEVFNRRRLIVTGEKEPNDDECDWPNEEKELENITLALKNICVKEGNNIDESIRGIPDFWFFVLKNAPLVNEMIQPNDEPILKCLEDVKCILVSGEEPGFYLEFHFKENDYFSDKCLTKRYFFSYQPSDDAPLEYEGPEIVRAKGCAINWKPGKNVTVTLVKKVQKHKGRGEKRTITKAIKQDSFFNFFDPPVYDLTSDLDEETEDLLEADFKIGQAMREGLIPRAVLYFTGEALEPEYDDECEDEDMEDDDEESNESDDDNVQQLGSSGGQKGKKKRGPHPTNGAKDTEKPECEQQ